MTKASFGPQIEAGKKRIEARKQAAVDEAVADTTTTVRAAERAIYQPRITDLQTTNARLAEEKEEQYGLGVQSVQDEIDRLSPDSHLRYSKDHFWTAHNKYQERQLKLMQDAREERHAQQPLLTFETMGADPTSYFGTPEDYAYPTPVLPAILAPRPTFGPAVPGFILEDDEHSQHSGVPRLMPAGENDGDDATSTTTKTSRHTGHSKRSSARHSHRSKREDSDNSDSDDTIRQDKKTKGSRSVASSHHSRRSSRSHQTSTVVEGRPLTYPIIGYTRSGDTIRQRDGSTIWHVVPPSGIYEGERVTQFTDITGRVHLNRVRLAELAAEQAERDADHASQDYILVIREGESRHRRGRGERAWS